MLYQQSAVVVLLSALIVCTIVKPCIGLDASAYKNSQKLDEGLTLYWDVNSNEGSIQFAVTGKTAGYIAIGLSEVGAMIGSDIMFGTVSNGKAMVVDAFAYNKSMDDNSRTLGVLVDSQQDIKTISGEQYTDANGDTWTSLEFSRPLNTSDCNDRPILEGSTQLIWAIGSSDEMVWHGTRRGGMHLALYGQTYLKNSFPPYNESLDFTVSPYNVPTKYTTYTCTTFNVSTMLPTKRHAIGFSAVLNSTFPASLHHFVIYSCQTPQQIAKASATPPNQDCTETGPPCNSFVGGWAVGAKPIILPDNVGQPFGPGTSNTILVLELHYTNPEGRSDIWDSSGMRFPLSPKLLDVEAGAFALGVFNSSGQIRIPPNQESWVMENTCSASCTDGLIDTNITIIASILHQHLIGSQIWTTLKRNGGEIETLNRADYYAFDYQQWIEPTKPLVVYPGDQLHTVCVWDSRGRNTTTLGGPSTMQEMCLNFFLYYPRKETVIGGCTTVCLDRAMATGRASPGANIFGPFDGDGAVVDLCMRNATITPATCKYGDMNGRSEIMPKLHGCPAKSIARLSADVQGTLETPSKRSQSSAFSRRSSIGNIFIVGCMNCLFVVLIAHLLQ